MSINAMRLAIASVYSASYANRLSDSQILPIFSRLRNSGKIKL